MSVKKGTPQPRPRKMQNMLHKIFTQEPHQVEALVRSLIQLGINGDINAIKLLFDRDSGKVVDEVIVHGNSGVNPYDQLSDDELIQQANNIH